MNQMLTQIYNIYIYFLNVRNRMYEISCCHRSTYIPYEMKPSGDTMPRKILWLFSTDRKTIPIYDVNQLGPHMNILPMYNYGSVPSPLLTVQTLLNRNERHIVCFVYVSECVSLAIIHVYTCNIFCMQITRCSLCEKHHKILLLSIFFFTTHVTHSSVHRIVHI